MNLQGRIFHLTNRLAGGERQRVAVARAAVNQPQLILTDEPTGQLDRANSHMIMDYFREIVATRETAILVVTHNGSIAARCHRMYYLEDGILHA